MGPPLPGHPGRARLTRVAHWSRCAVDSVSIRALKGDIRRNRSRRAPELPSLLVVPPARSPRRAAGVAGLRGRGGSSRCTARDRPLRRGHRADHRRTLLPARQGPAGTDRPLRPVPAAPDTPVQRGPFRVLRRPAHRGPRRPARNARARRAWPRRRTGGGAALRVGGLGQVGTVLRGPRLRRQRGTRRTGTRYQSRTRPVHACGGRTRRGRPHPCRGLRRTMRPGLGTGTGHHLPGPRPAPARPGVAALR